MPCHDGRDIKIYERNPHAIRFCKTQVFVSQANAETGGYVSCPQCGSHDWKFASAVHAGGLSAVTTNTVGVGVGADADVSGGSVGGGVGVARASGTQQTELSKIAAPPTKPMTKSHSRNRRQIWILKMWSKRPIQSRAPTVLKPLRLKQYCASTAIASYSA